MDTLDAIVTIEISQRCQCMTRMTVGSGNGLNSPKWHNLMGCLELDSSWDLNATGSYSEFDPISLQISWVTADGCTMDFTETFCAAVDHSRS